MDDNDLVFVPGGSSQVDGDGAAEVFEDFVDLKEASEVKPEDIQVHILLTFWTLIDQV